jgi:D-hydantoinase
MARLDLRIAGGTVATSADVFQADIGVRDGRIVAIGDDLPPAEETIDARGKLVVPGGVDGHCHMDQQPWEGRETADDFLSGTVSAACGGTTTVIPFAMQLRGQSLSAIVADYHERARPKAVVDYAFHLIVGDPTAQVLGQELPPLMAEGCTSIKIYLTYDLLVLSDRQVLEVLDFARREGAVVMVHAENDDCIRWLTDRLIATGKTAFKYHGVAHSVAGEREATHRAITLAEVAEVPVLIAHVSTGAAAAQIRAAQARGLRVMAETCPQYLFLTADHMDTHDMEGTKYVCTPPPRTVADQGHIWRALADGTFQVFSSDHSPWRDAVPQGAERRARHRDTTAAAVLGGSRQGAPDAAPVRRARRDQPGAHLWSLPAQGDHRGGFGCGSGRVGHRAHGDHHQRHAAPRHGLHGVRGHDRHRLADPDPLARRSGMARRRSPGTTGPRAIPAVRPGPGVPPSGVITAQSSFAPTSRAPDREFTTNRSPTCWA